jgi:tetratricopeptide (TPR) repeat protein
MKRCAIAFVALIIAIVSLPAEARSEHDHIVQLYQRALAGDEWAVGACITALEAILRSEPDNQLARVYLGSTYTLRSRDLTFGPAKLRMLKKGVALMDAAANGARDNARVRLVRALTNESLPFFIGRRKDAQEEFYALAEMIQRDPTKLAESDQQLLYLNAGLAAKKSGDKKRAAEFWRRGLTKRADPKLKAQLNSALAKL